MKKLISVLATFAVLGAMIAVPCSAATEYASSVSSMEKLDSSVPTGMAVWDACKLPVKFEANTANKFDGKHSLKIYCTNNDAPEGSEWHSNFYWDTNVIDKSDWSGTQYLEFWVKNDTHVNLGIQIQFTENNKNNQPGGEPWRTKVKTDVLYEDNGSFVKQTSDVGDAAQYNEFSKSTEGAVAVPKGFCGRIRIALNANNFRRAEWFAPRPGDGSNNVIDKNNIGQLSFGWDPRVVDNNAAWYLDSIRLVAPNANLKGGVPYDTLTKQINGGGSSGGGTVSKTPSKTESKVISATSSKKGSGASTVGNTTSGVSEPALSSDMGSTVSESSLAESTGSQAAENSSAAAISKDGKDGLSVGAVVAIVIACVVVLGGAVGIFLVMNKDKIFKKKS